MLRRRPLTILLSFKIIRTNAEFRVGPATKEHHPSVSIDPQPWFWSTKTKSSPSVFSH